MAEGSHLVLELFSSLHVLFSTDLHRDGWWEVFKETDKEGMLVACKALHIPRLSIP